MGHGHSHHHDHDHATSADGDSMSIMSGESQAPPSITVFSWKDKQTDEPQTFLEREKQQRRNQQHGEPRLDGAGQDNIDLVLSVPTVFRWENGGKKVELSGSFTQWHKIPMKKTADEFFLVINLEEGVHEYKFHVDGIWRHDPKRETTPDVFDGYKNVVRVSLTESNFADALNADEQVNQAKNQQFPHPTGYMRGVPNAPIPHGTIPPAMPPQLLHSILNDPQPGEDELMDKAEMTMPSHVCVNHLYALSIKDNVITVSSTQKYQRKYITTILYKPIK